jgi:hypothetical protein
MAGKKNGKTGKITRKQEKDKKEFDSSKMSIEGTKAADAPETAPSTADEQKAPEPQATPAERTRITGEDVLKMLRAKGMKI